MIDNLYIDNKIKSFEKKFDDNNTLLENINKFLIEKQEKEELNLTQEQVQKEELNLTQEQVQKEELEALVETISTSVEPLNYKEEIIIFNNNLVDTFTYALVFIGFVIGILLSSFFLKGLYK